MPRQVYVQYDTITNTENELDFTLYKVGKLWKAHVKGAKQTLLCTLIVCPVCGKVGRQNDPLQYDHKLVKNPNNTYTASSCYFTDSESEESYWKAKIEADVLRIAHYTGYDWKHMTFSEDALKYAEGMGWVTNYEVT